MAAPYAPSPSRRTPKRISCSKSPSAGAFALNHIVGNIRLRHAASTPWSHVDGERHVVVTDPDGEIESIEGAVRPDDARAAHSARRRIAVQEERAHARRALHEP